MKNWQDYITSDAGVLNGKPIIKNTRLSVEFIIGRLANGWSEEQILESYPRLKKEGLLAIYAYLYSCVQDGLLFMPREARA